MSGHIAIIGAGLAGLAAARALSKAMPDTAQITVFDKSRGVSGRLATRYADPWQFDHGAQYFTARTADFKAEISQLAAEGVVAVWQPRTGLTPPRRSGSRYVAVPKMNALGKALADGLDIVKGTQITAMERIGGFWHLTDEAGTVWGQYDHVICAVPSPQVQALLPQDFEDRAILDEVRMLPTFTAMLGFAGPWSGDWDMLHPDSDMINIISVNSSKPGRDKSVTSIVIHAENDWSAANVDADKTQVLADIVREFEGVSGVDARLAKHKSVHRWLYANVGEPAGTDFLFDAAQNIVACGDWCLEGRVEAAWLSGTRAGQYVADLYQEPRAKTDARTK